MKTAPAANFLIACALACFAILPAIADRGGEQIVILKDGSQLRGEVSMSGNGYSITTRSMGTISVDVSEVVSVSGRTASAVPAEKIPTQSVSTFESVRVGLMSNPQVLANILKLQNDPDMQAVLTDPEVMRAIQRLDFEALAKNPKIKALMDNPAVKSLQAGSK